jgi:putative DNA primase/helicase
MARATNHTRSVSKRGRIALTAAEVAEYYRVRVPKLKQTAAAEWCGPCPIHDGTHDKFYVDSRTGLWHCHSKCGRGGDVFQLEKELSGLPDFPAAKRAVLELIGRGPEMEERAPEWEVVAEYIYRDETGGPLFRVQRKRRMGATGWEKTFAQSRWLDGRWVSGVKGVRLVPYRLPELVAAEMMEPVFVCEGEKDVDRLAGVGLTATCNPMGAGKARMFSDWLGYFRGRHLVILPDNDLPGRKHAAEVAGVLLPVAAAVRVLELPGLPEKGDLYDWLDAGGTVEELRRLAAEAAVIDADGLVALRARWGLAVEEP